MNYRNSRNLRIGKRTVFHEQTSVRMPRPGEVWNAQNLEFEGEIGCKSRPVIVIRSDKTRTFYLRCTSSHGPGRVELYDPESCGLRFGTNIRAELESIDTSRLNRKLGILDDFDRRLVDITLTRMASGQNVGPTGVY